MKNKMISIFKSILHFGELFVSVALLIDLSSVNLLLSLLISTPLIVYTASKLNDDLTGNTINNSIFSVSKTGYIKQNPLVRPKHFLSISFKKDKREVFENELLNMISQLEEKNSKGDTITYGALSHTGTIKYLKLLKDEGYIENLNYTYKKDTNLIIEKLTMGNIKGLINSLKTGKKYKMYDITFNLTSKDRSKDKIYQDILQAKNKSNSDEDTMNNNSKENKLDTNEKNKPFYSKPQPAKYVYNPNKSKEEYNEEYDNNLTDNNLDYSSKKR